MDKLWETACIATAYVDHLRYRDPSRPKKKRKPDLKHEDFAASATSVTSSVTVQVATTGKEPNGSTTTASVGKRKREDDEANLINNNTEREDPNITTATGPGDSGEVQISASIPPASSDASPAKESAPRSDFNFYLHRPSLGSRHTVVIPLPPDAKLATSLTNRRVLEFPTIYVFHKQSDGKLPEGFISEEDFFASAEKELITVVAEETYIGGFAEKIEERESNGLEDGEVEEGRLLEALAKDSKGIAGLL